MPKLTARLIPYLLAAFWLAAYLAGGWAGVLFVAAVGIAFDILLFAAARLQAEADECADVTTAEERWRDWERAA